MLGCKHYLKATTTEKVTIKQAQVYVQKTFVLSLSRG